MDPMQGTSVVVFAAGGGVVAIFADRLGFELCLCVLNMTVSGQNSLHTGMLVAFEILMLTTSHDNGRDHDDGQLLLLLFLFLL